MPRFQSNHKRPGWFCYVVSIFAVGVALGLRFLLHPYYVATPFLLFYPAITLTALYAGFGPGLLAIFLSALSAAFLLNEPQVHAVTSPAAQAIGIATFIVVNLLIVWTCERMRRASQRAAQAEAAKKNAEFLAAQAQKFQEAEQRLLFALEAGKIGVWDWDLSQNTVWRSLVHDQIFGYPDLLPVWRHETFLEHIIPEDRPKIQEHTREVIGAPEDMHWSMECRIRRADGEIRWICIQGRRIGAPHHLQGLVQDITERKQMEQDMQQAKETALAANAAKDRFLAILSHELRTPLTPVLMSISDHESDPALTPELRADLAMIRRNLELESRLIDDLLDLNRLARGKITLHIQPTDLHRTLQHVLAICREEIGAKKQELHLELESVSHSVNGDAGRLQQVFWNLLKNATKFTPAGGSITIRSVNPRNGVVRVEVADTGMGIPPQVIPQLFAPFEQGGTWITRQFGGLGMGLAICKALVDLHGGKIWGESAGEGQGATFFVEFPTLPIRVPPESGPALVRQAPQWEPRIGNRKIRILLVEDNADTLRILGRLLEKSGCLVSSALNMQGALAAAQAARERSERFDILISDLGLPDGDGCELMRRLRGEEGLAGIAISGYGMEEDIQRSHDAGFAEHLTKPVRLEELQAAISRLAGDQERRSH